MPIVMVNGGGNTPQGAHRQPDFVVSSTLQRLGVSTVGAYQLLNGQVVTSAEDRACIAGIVAQVLDPHVTASG